MKDMLLELRFEPRAQLHQARQKKKPLRPEGSKRKRKSKGSLEGGFVRRHETSLFSKSTSLTFFHFIIHHFPRFLFVSTFLGWWACHLSLPHPLSTATLRCEALPRIATWIFGSSTRWKRARKNMSTRAPGGGAVKFALHQHVARACGVCGAIVVNLMTSGFSRALPRRGRPGEREFPVESHCNCCFGDFFFGDALTLSSLSLIHHFGEGASLCGWRRFLSCSGCCCAGDHHQRV